MSVTATYWLGRFMQPDPIEDGDGPNLYAYVGNDPVNYTDPSGEVGLAGAGASVLLGGAIRFATAQPVFDARAIATDAALGAIGAGVVSKAVQLGRLGGLGLSAGTRLRATSSLARAPTEGVYVLRQGGRSYAGQSGDLATRSAVSAAERGLTSAPVVRLGVAGGKTSREVAEQRVINAFGGKNAPGVLNRVNPIGAKRGSLLTQPGLGSVNSAYAPGASTLTQAATGAAVGARSKER